MRTLLIFLGAGFGGVLRYWVSLSIGKLFIHQFPYGTLVVNASGSFLMGLLAALISKYFDGASSLLGSLVLIGFLGGYTTFSAFSLETLFLVENGVRLDAFLYVLSSVFLCIILAWLGLFWGRQI